MAGIIGMIASRKPVNLKISRTLMCRKSMKSAEQAEAWSGSSRKSPPQFTLPIRSHEARPSRNHLILPHDAPILKSPVTTVPLSLRALQ